MQNIRLPSPQLMGWVGGFTRLGLWDGQTTKTDEFSENPKRGVPLNPKIYVTDFGLLHRAFFGRFPKKMQHNFPKMRGVKGHLEFFRKFIRLGSLTRP